MASYSIEIDFALNWPPDQRDTLESAARAWEALIGAPVPPITLRGRRIDGLLVRAEIQDHGVSGGLARCGPDRVRPGAAGAAAYLPATADLALNAAQFDILRSTGRLRDVLFHELAHALGFGTVWNLKGLITGSGGRDPQFVGAKAVAEFAALVGRSATGVPVENNGPAGTANRHWRETVFGEEMMSSYLPTADNPLSRLTLASMADLGYVIDISASEQYALPVHLHQWTKQMRERRQHYIHRFRIPRVLPDSALIKDGTG
jgi:hypothetical protein